MPVRKRFKFGTFNTTNLALPNVSFYGKFYGKRYNESEYKAKVAWTGRMIRQMDADFIGFQEIGSDQAPRDALDAAKLRTRSALTAV